jgi:alpha-amylase/alpha-mannosidase (GH57 family)
MHQPYYKNDFTGFYELPWVFLHAIKDYYEMPKYFQKFTKIKAVFNLVPSLLAQVQDYAEGKANDVLLQILKKEVGGLSPEEKQKLIPNLFMANVENMILPSPRYTELLNKYEREGASGKFQSFSNQDLLDLEILFLTAWTGTFIREEEKFIGQLILKDRNYTEEEKTSLFAALLNNVRAIIPLYNSLYKDGRIELSTTPFYHPIIPLLIDLTSAKEVYPNVVLPRKETSFSIDAAWQIDEAMKYFEKQFGEKPEGFWPSEGSISKESADMFSYFGAKWIASDEDVLSNSIRKPLNSKVNRNLLYKKYKYLSENGEIYVFFRDKKLSDMIGFHFADYSKDAAVDSFMEELKSIYDTTNFNPHVNVILDGENAWEFYKDNGRHFLSALYERIENTPWIKTLTFSEAIEEESIPVDTIDNIVAGSWIYGNLLTWIGHEEKNKAWEMLGLTRQKVDSQSERLSDRERAELYNELYIAEGSDWFWWYGDDHFSPQADVFDKLFRSHLINAFKIVSLPIPYELYTPIKAVAIGGVIKEPSDFIYPVIDGKISNFFEWMGSGVFNLRYDMGTMHTTSSYLKTLYWGFNQRYLFLRIEGDVNTLINKDFELEVKIFTKFESDICALLDELNKTVLFNGVVCDEILFGIKNIIELSIPLDTIKLENGDHIMFVARLKHKEEILERVPLYSYAKLTLNKNIAYNWVV